MTKSEELLELMRDIHIEATKKGLLQKRDDYNLTFIQRSLLKFLSQKGQISMTELSNLLFVKKPAMTRIIDRLEKSGLVKRLRIHGDRRGYKIALTGKGKKRVGKLNKVPLNVLNKILLRCTQDESEMVFKVGELLLNGLQKTQA
jgi:DNA-binding MarR family transcriptional regulator